MLIDAHYHLLINDGYISDAIKEMDELGIEKTVITGLPGEWMFMGCMCGTNEDVLKVVKSHPDRFVGSVYLDPRQKDVLDTLHRYADESFKAAKFHSTVGYYMDNPEYFPVYEELNNMGWPATVHCGLTNLPYANQPERTTDSKFADPIYLDGVLRLFPKINWVIAHMGWPYFDIVWGLVQFNENVYMDLSGPYPPINGLDRIRREGFGFTCDVDMFSRMIWGSDGIDTGKYFKIARKKLIELGQEKNIEAIFGGTMVSLLGLKK